MFYVVRNKQELDRAVGVGRLAANATHEAVLGFEDILTALADGRVEGAKQVAQTWLNQSSLIGEEVSEELSIVENWSGFKVGGTLRRMKRWDLSERMRR
jgi:hypothetical protein